MTEKGAGWTVSGFGSGEERICPYCGQVVNTLQEEIAHMDATHPEVVTERLRAAGAMGAEPIMDYRHGPDLPSFMTLSELRILHVLIERMAIIEGPISREGTEISILVRDRGQSGRGIKASWIEFSIDGVRYAVWRATMALHTVDEHGAVSDDPILSPD